MKRAIQQYRMNIKKQIEERLQKLFQSKQVNHYDNCEVLGKAIVNLLYL